MQSYELFSEIGRVLPTNEAVQVLAALRQDPLVWQHLGQADFMRLALERAGSQSACWSPGGWPCWP